MRIDKIELIGFKSFAEKTLFQLHPGITCIIGPNGSGKSNIVDSFRWVLGEQSAKSLRGEKMDEVIFGGSATKKPRGMSEVNLVLLFDSLEQGNGDSPSQTTISRRLYRSGESEYLINRSVCRLKDIRDLFLDTGLEIRSYSILEQGRISEILNSKPLERRFLIEEVAGVMKYKVRRAEAQSKLESSRLNLQRIHDIVSEVKRQINSLDRQVKKAERFQRLSAELREIELKLAKREHSAMREALDALGAEQKAGREEETGYRAELGSIDNARETRRLGLLEKEKSMEALMAELQGREREIAEAERLVAVAVTETNHLKESITKLSLQESEAAVRIEEAGKRKDELGASETTLAREIETYGEELSEKHTSIKDLEDRVTEKERLVETKRREVFQLAEELSHIRNETGRLTTSLENLEKKGLSSRQESEAVRDQLDRIEADIREAEGMVAGKAEVLLLLAEQKKDLALQIDAETAAIEEMRGDIARSREELASVSSRLDSLKEIVLEEFSREIAAESARFPVLASVAEIIDVEEQYEKAIENSLSEKVNGLIVTSRDDIASAASELRDKRIGRTVFISQDAGHGAAERSDDQEGPQQGAVVGRAADLVRVPEEKHRYLPVVRSLLDDVWVVRDLEAAFSLSRSERHARIVTLDGELVEPSGAVTIGEGKGVLRRKREIRELTALIDQKKHDVERREALLAETESGLLAKREEFRGVESSIVAAEKEISLIRMSADTLLGEKEKVSRKLAYLHIEQEDASRESETLTSALAAKQAEAESITQRQSEAERLIGEIQQAIADMKGHYEAERSSVTDLRLTLNSYRERMEAVRREVEQVSDLLRDLRSSQDRLAQERRDTEARILDREAETEKGNENLKVLVVKADTLRAVISENREIIRTEAEDLARIEQDAKALRIRLDSLSSLLAGREVSLAELRVKLEGLTEGVRQNYGIDIESFVTEPVAPEDEDRLTEVRKKIEELGPVNLGTLEEYEELKTRYDFLSRQEDDLNKSIAELEEAISKINSSTRKKLRDAFEQLNAKFSEVFAYLFGGGKAELVLTDETNILETGIDIIAQPPGKKLQNINLLSGGEKALTALSLLFASFLIKPSPLCVLDEVDAPLDEANVGRFASMLRDLSDKIQFIVVTHNRITMESADYLYGITMEEPGVSKVISMQLVDKQSP